jgi:hypothetical protein
MFSRHRCQLAVVVALLFCHTLQAALFLQEPFDFSPGILGTNPPWTNPADFIQVSTNSLFLRGLAGLVPAGRAAAVSAGGTSTTFSLRPFTNAVSSGKVYLSFLLNYTRPDANVTFAGLLPSSLSGPGGSSADPCDLIVQKVTEGYQLGIRAKTGTTRYASNHVLTPGKVYFVVAKYDFAASKASLYVNANPGSSEPAAPDAYSTGAAVSDLKSLYLRVYDSTAGDFLLDTVRVASTWEEATPYTPPPPANTLVFTAAPVAGTAGTPLSRVTVEIQDPNGCSVPSNNVPLTLTPNPGAFASGTTTAMSDTNGTATFDGLRLDTPALYTLTASASGIGAGLAAATSGVFEVGAPRPISEQGYALAAFLDSLQVEQYWTNTLSVNWLTGAALGTGTNMTKGNASHCSAFAAAAAKLLGVYLLRPWDASDLGLANLQADWLQTNSADWYAIPSMTDAQQFANSGALVVASYKEPNGSAGHIAIVRPSPKSDAEVWAAGPQECQSGIHNFNSTNVARGFDQHAHAFPEGIRYYGHPIPGPIVPVNPVFGSSTWSNNLFRAAATTIVGRSFRLQATSDFKTWAEVLAFTNSNDSSNFFCPTVLTNAPASGSVQRFYRLLAP